MVEPSIDMLVDRMEKKNKYLMVGVVSKRARELVETKACLDDGRGSKPVTAAMYEILDGRIKYRSHDSGIK